MVTITKILVCKKIYKYIYIEDDKDEEHGEELYGFLWGGRDAPCQTREAEFKKNIFPWISLQKDIVEIV